MNSNASLILFVFVLTLINIVVGSLAFPSTVSVCSSRPNTLPFAVTMHLKSLVPVLAFSALASAIPQKRAHESASSTYTPVPVPSGPAAPAGWEAYASTYPHARYGPTNQWVQVTKDGDNCYLIINLDFCSSLTPPVGKWDAASNTCNHRFVNITTCDGLAQLRMDWTNMASYDDAAGTLNLHWNNTDTKEWYNLDFPLGFKPTCRAWWDGTHKFNFWTEPWCYVNTKDWSPQEYGGAVHTWWPSTVPAVPSASVSTRPIKPSASHTARTTGSARITGHPQL
ncbi:uncharacterized protein N7459_004572 [Penicillium hispanicum]|uniref:uncharacterized protein n=1 Tax=Penicillium hispanicum TaxID=1080232 RepID=UPI0025412E49|nr:uncharacterized protein N7459_004572 [Penicillium hispanicum]KAJ5584772.1 hypothetical protein N7459_004572 [Penicillium hispanicum]